jgi:regulatory protein
MNDNQKLFETALNKVIDFLSYSSRTRKEVLNRIDKYLLKKDLTTEEENELKEYVLEEVDKLNLLDDKLYAKNYVEGRIRSGKSISKRKIQEFLYMKGVDKQIIETALQSYTSGMEIDLVRQLAEKKIKTLKYKDRYSGKRKLTAYLLGKGFTSSVVFEMVNQLFPTE